MAKGLLIAVMVLMALGMLSQANNPDGPQDDAAKAEFRQTVDAMVACETALRGKARHPSTVDFHMGGGSKNRQGDGWLIKKSFDASNSFGLEMRMTGLCAVGPKGDVLWAHAEETQ